MTEDFSDGLQAEEPGRALTVAPPSRASAAATLAGRGTGWHLQRPRSPLRCRQRRRGRGAARLHLVSQGGRQRVPQSLVALPAGKADLVSDVVIVVVKVFAVHVPRVAG